jgi:hypothetical protein
MGRQRMAEPLVSGLEAYWRHRDEIIGLTDPRFYPIDWIDAQVWAGRIRLLHDDKALIAFEIKDYPGGAREINGMFAAGDLQAIMGLIDQAEDFARSIGCHVATIESRTGWAKALKGRGYRPHQLRIQKEL